MVGIGATVIIEVGCNVATTCHLGIDRGWISREGGREGSREEGKERSREEGKERRREEGSG